MYYKLLQKSIGNICKRKKTIKKKKKKKNTKKN